MGWLDDKAAAPDVLISRGSFFPPVSRARFITEYRPPAELPLDTVTAHLRQAVIYVGRQLDEWRNTQTAATLADVPAETVAEVRDGETVECSELIALFDRAVYCEAKAEILKETQTADRRAAAENSAKTGNETEEKYREFAADAISLIVGGDRVYVGGI